MGAVGQPGQPALDAVRAGRGEDEGAQRGGAARRPPATTSRWTPTRPAPDSRSRSAPSSSPSGSWTSTRTRGGDGAVEPSREPGRLGPPRADEGERVVQGRDGAGVRPLVTGVDVGQQAQPRPRRLRPGADDREHDEGGRGEQRGELADEEPGVRGVAAGLDDAQRPVPQVDREEVLVRPYDLRPALVVDDRHQPDEVRSDRRRLPVLTGDHRSQPDPEGVVVVVVPLPQRAGERRARLEQDHRVRHGLGPGRRQGSRGVRRLAHAGPHRHGRGHADPGRPPAGRRAGPWTRSRPRGAGRARRAPGTRQSRSTRPARPPRARAGRPPGAGRPPRGRPGPGPGAASRVPAPACAPGAGAAARASRRPGR